MLDRNAVEYVRETGFQNLCEGSYFVPVPLQQNNYKTYHLTHLLSREPKIKRLRKNANFDFVGYHTEKKGSLAEQIFTFI